MTDNESQDSSGAKAKRRQLEDFLSRSSAEQLLAAFQEPWLNGFVPGLNRLAGCDQGTVAHLEGDVAVHTALVFDNLKKVAAARLKRPPDLIENLSVLLHDLRKPDTRAELAGGVVGFPGHEALAGPEAERIARELELSAEESARLHFIVIHHGDAHSWLELSASLQNELRSSPWVTSLALLQEADARSCLFPDGTHLPVFWNELVNRF